jgi:competence protein ComEC
MLRENPIVRLLIPFVVGILAYVSFNPGISVVFLVTLLILGFIIIYSLTQRYSFYNQWITSLVIACVMVLAGMGAVALRDYLMNHRHFASGIERDSLWLARIEDYGQEKARSVKYVAEIIAGQDGQQWRPYAGKLLIYLEKDSASVLLQPGDKILFYATPLTIPGPALPGGFNYREYLARRGIYYQLYLKNSAWKKVSFSESFSLRQTAAQWRGKLLGVMKKYGLEGQEYAVASAMLLGYSSVLDSETRQIYSGSGAMHVLCVSGLHVGIIYMFVGVLLTPLLRLKKGKLLRSVICIVIIWFYAMLTGLSASVIRAATMFSFLSIGQMAGRRTGIYNTLAASAFFILLFNLYLLFEIGFQLSYLAVLGIVSIQPGLYHLLNIKNKILDKVWALLSVSIAAQLATGPMATFYFHQFPSYFLLTNLWVIPVSFACMFLGVLFFLTSWIYPLAKITGWLLALGFKVMNTGVSIIEGLPGAVIKGLYPDIFLCVGIYGFLIFLVLYLYFSRKWLFYSALISILAISARIPAQWLLCRNQPGQIVVAHSKSLNGLILVKGRSVALSDDVMLGDKTMLDWLGDKGIDNISVLKKHSCIQWNGRIICMAYGDSIVKPLTGRADYLFLLGKVTMNPSKIIQSLKPSAVIVGPDVPAYIIKRWKEKLHGSSIRFHAVREEGYFEELL